MRKRIITATAVICLLLSGCTSEKETAEQKVTEIKIYDYEDFMPDENGRENNDPVVITDSETIAELTKLGGDTSLYKEWTGEQYEGMNSYWIDYGNGLIVGMYDDIDYGNFCEYAGEPYGSPYYKIPDGLRERVIELSGKE